MGRKALLGEVPVAAIHVTPGESITGQELIDWAYGDIASAKIPRYVAVGHELPYSGRGKVQKFILRDQLAEIIDKGELEKLVPSEVKEKKKKGGKGKSSKSTLAKLHTAAHSARNRENVFSKDCL